MFTLGRKKPAPPGETKRLEQVRREVAELIADTDRRVEELLKRLREREAKGKHA